MFDIILQLFCILVIVFFQIVQMMKEFACHSHIREQLKSITNEHKNNNNEEPKKKKVNSEHSSILDVLEDDSNITSVDDADDEWDDDFDTRNVEYSLPKMQADELSKYLSVKIDTKKYPSDVITYYSSSRLLHYIALLFIIMCFFHYNEK